MYVRERETAEGTEWDRNTGIMGKGGGKDKGGMGERGKRGWCFSLLRGRGLEIHLCLVETSSVIAAAAAACVCVCVVGLDNKTILKSHRNHKTRLNEIPQYHWPTLNIPDKYKSSALESKLHIQEEIKRAPWFNCPLTRPWRRSWKPVTVKLLKRPEKEEEQLAKRSHNFVI